MAEKISVGIQSTYDDKGAKAAIADAKKIESAKPTLKVEADTTKVRKSVQEIIGLAEKLDGKSAKMLMETNAKAIDREIRALIGVIGKLDAEDAEVEVKVARLSKLQGDLGDIRSKIREVDGAKAEVEVTVDDKASGQLDAITDKLDELPGAFGSIGTAIGSGGLAGAAAAIGGGLVLAADASADLAINAKTTASLTGDTVEDASRLQSVWKLSGADLNDLNDVLLQMHGALVDSPELAKQLGINLDDGRTIGERFVQVTGMIENGLIDSRTQSKLFGEEGVRQVAKLETIVSGDLQNALDGVSETQIISEADVESALQLKQQFAELKSLAADIMTELGRDVRPIVGGGAESLSFVNRLRDDIKGIPVLGDIFENVSPTEQAQTRIRQIKGLFGDTEDAAKPLPPLFDMLNTAIDGAANAARNAEGDFVSYNDAIEGSLTAIQAEADAAVTAADAINGMANARRAAADAGFAAREAERNFAETLAATAEQIKAHPGMTMENAAALDDFAVSAGTAADADMRYAQEQAEAMGVTMSASDAQGVWNRSMITSARTTTGPMKQAIVNYIAEVNGIPPEKVSDILANTDYATVEEAQEALDDVAAKRDAEIAAEATNVAATNRQLDYLADKKRTAYVDAVLRQTGSWVLGSDRGGVIGPDGGLVAEKRPEFVRFPGSSDEYLVTSPSLVPAGTQVTSGAETARILERQAAMGGGGDTTNVTINVPRGSRPDDVIRAADRYARRNGRSRARR